MPESWGLLLLNALKNGTNCNRKTIYRLKLRKKFLKSHWAVSSKKFMHDNVSNPEFLTKLMEIAWESNDYNEVLRLAKDGVRHDSELAGLVSDWRKWELKVYKVTNDRDNTLELSKYFFFDGERRGEKEYSMETMYGLMKSLITPDNWMLWVESLLKESKEQRKSTQILYIYTQEEMWDKYLAYLRMNATLYSLDDAPKEIRKLFKEEFVSLYEKCVREFFISAGNRDHYREGVEYLRNLIKYRGKKKAERIIEEQRSRRPRRPALIEELSKI